MSENIELLFNIKEIQICWREESTTDARITTPPSQTSTRSLRHPVSIRLEPCLAARFAAHSHPELYRWQTHDPILEEKRRCKPRWNPQTQITRSLSPHSHSENRRSPLRWQINSFWSQRQVCLYLILTYFIGSCVPSWSRRWSRWRDSCSRRRDPPRRTRRASQRARRSSEQHAKQQQQRVCLPVCLLAVSPKERTVLARSRAFSSLPFVALTATLNSLRRSYLKFTL